MFWLSSALAASLVLGTPLPADQTCVVDVTVADSTPMSWRVATQTDQTLAVSTSLPEGKRQAVFQTSDATWFQTEGMARPMRVGLAQRVLGQLSIADVIDPRQAAGWEVVSESPTSVVAVAREGSGLAYAKAEFERANAKVSTGRFYGASGTLMRTVSYLWRGDSLATVAVTDVSRPNSPTRISISAPRCDTTPLVVSETTVMSAALSLLGTP